MYFNLTLNALIPSSTSVTMLLGFFTYLGVTGSILLGKVVPGLLTLVLRVAPLGIGAMANRGLELLSATSIISFLVTLSLYMAGCRSRDQGSSLKPHVTGNLIHDWWFGTQQNPQFMGTDYFFL
ncbi:Delta(14)-sterol reductase [Camellia lanceoleosa]|uniref:Delta(14)-sterol reductase n=1 Tax=Camellia lanceoleosa TaxID=1840588 RepID=A0ACC0GEQ0_9ERIC|nr:Delta(14)-sterol reductase [Camellia lanceoleosa]